VWNLGYTGAKPNRAMEQMVWYELIGLASLKELEAFITSRKCVALAQPDQWGCCCVVRAAPSRRDGKAQVENLCDGETPSQARRRSTRPERAMPTRIGSQASTELVSRPHAARGASANEIG